YVRDVMKLNDKERNFRVFSPDEAASNRLYAMFEETKRQWVGEIDEPYDEFLAPDGRILDSMLSEHIAEGALEAYLLTGRHGFIHSYESFLRVVDSMITQHFKWLNQCEDIPWRADIPSLNLINTSHIWQQDHNGYTHQDPGMLGHLADKNSGLIHEYLPADANTLLVTFDKCMRSINQVNVMTASKHPRQQWFTIEEAEYLVNKGLGIVDWASTDKNGETDIVFAMAGDTPTLEGLAAVQLLHEYLPDLKIRFVNIVDLLKLQSPKVYEHGISDEEFNMIFTKDKPIIFGFHGYENLVDTLFFKRDNHNVSVHGYRDKGEITTGFDMRVMNELDRFNLVKDAIYHLPKLGNKGAHIIQEMNEKLEIHTKFVHENGIDLPEIANWQWKGLK
ncbi:MAG: phosphoketolase, partial [Clostridium butyricum]